MGLDFSVWQKGENTIFNTNDFKKVTVSEEMGNFLYKNRHLVNSDISFFFSIDPYSSGEFLNINEIQELNKNCIDIINSKILLMYDYNYDFEKNAFEKLYSLTDFCIKNNFLLFFIGD